MEKREEEEEKAEGKVEGGGPTWAAGELRRVIPSLALSNSSIVSGLIFGLALMLGVERPERGWRRKRRRRRRRRAIVNRKE